MRVAAAAILVTLLGAAVVVGVGCADEPLHQEYPPYVPVVVDDGPQVWEGEDAVGVEELPHRGVLGPPYPVILVHGFSGWNDLGPVGYFFEVADDLRAAGVDVYTPALPPYNVSDERARVLASVIDAVLEATGKEKVHLIGHSQGGIDIRRTVSELGLGYAPVVASVTTVSTPYEGTSVADLAAAAPDGVLNPAGQLLAWLLGAGEGEPPSETAWADDSTSDAWTPALADSTRGLTPAVMTELVARTPWPREVPFFTVAGVSNLASLDADACAGGLWSRSDRVDAVDAFLVGSGLYLSSTEGPNDGLVSVRSARAPESTFLGCVPADHFDEMGQIADFGPGLVSGFNHKDLYRNLVGNARSVED